MIFQVLSTYPVTHFCSSPTGMRLMKTEDVRGIKFKALKHCTGAGEPVVSFYKNYGSPKVLNFFYLFFIKLQTVMYVCSVILSLLFLSNFNALCIKKY